MLFCCWNSSAKTAIIWYRSHQKRCQLYLWSDNCSLLEASRVYSTAPWRGSCGFPPACHCPWHFVSVSYECWGLKFEDWSRRSPCPKKYVSLDILRFNVVSHFFFHRWLFQVIRRIWYFLQMNFFSLKYFWRWETCQYENARMRAISSNEKKSAFVFVLSEMPLMAASRDWKRTLIIEKQRKLYVLIYLHV